MTKQKQFLIAVFSFFGVLLFVFVILLMIMVKKTDAIVLKKDLTCNYRDEVYASDYIDKIDGTLLDKYLIDTSVVGKRTVDIKYLNKYGFVEQKRFEVEVKDVVPPMVRVDNPYIVGVSELSKLEDNIFCADDYDDNISCQIYGEYDLNKVGDYNLSIVAMDKSGNVTDKDFVLKVLDSKPNNNKDNGITKFSDVYNKYKNDNTEIGLDISKWQGNVDYDKLKSAGVSYVMLKIGGQLSINGDIETDPSFNDNIKNALKSGMRVGVYFYSKAKNANEAKKQARWVIQNIKDYNIDMPIAFDWENWDSFSMYNIGFRTLNKIANSFISEINRYGYRGILYSSKFYLENIWYQDEYDKWLAYYTNDNDYNKDYILWQMCNNGRIDGIDGNVDIDVLIKNKLK